MTQADYSRWPSIERMVNNPPRPSASVRSPVLTDAVQDRARDAVIRVLENHGYDLPGIADLAAGAALRSAGFIYAKPVTLRLTVKARPRLNTLLVLLGFKPWITVRAT